MRGLVCYNEKVAPLELEIHIWLSQWQLYTEKWESVGEIGEKIEDNEVAILKIDEYLNQWAWKLQNQTTVSFIRN